MTVPTSDAAPHVPDHETLRRIGHGSYGEVWLARNVAGSFRAVKVVRRASFESDRPYEREFNGLQKFEPVSRTHPGLVSVLHIGRNAAAEYFYYVMELADDVALGQQVDPERYRPKNLALELAGRGRLPVDECLELGMAIAAALHCLHEHGLVHRDVKPSNIIFVKGIPKLADIGLVTAIGSRATLVGTEGFLAPEGPGSPAADLYSLGKVLYEMSFGKSPDEFPELPTNLRTFPERDRLMQMNAVILRACDVQPGRRFRSGEELAGALAELRVGPSGVAGTSAGWPTPGPGGGRRILILAARGGPDETGLTRQLQTRLAAAGFNAATLEPGELTLEAARRLEAEIRGAHAVVPVLSATSIQDDLMAYALEIAHQALRGPSRLPLLLPVSYQVTGSLPRRLALALEGAPVIQADRSGDANVVVDRFLALLAPPTEVQAG